MEPRYNQPYPHQQPPPPPLRTPEDHRFGSIPPPPYSSQSPLAPRDPPRREDPFYPRRQPFDGSLHSPTRPDSSGYPPHPSSYPSNPYTTISAPNGHGPARGGYAQAAQHEHERRDLAEPRREGGRWKHFHLYTLHAFLLGPGARRGRERLQDFFTPWASPRTTTSKTCAHQRPQLSGS